MAAFPSTCVCGQPVDDTSAVCPRCGTTYGVPDFEERLAEVVCDRFMPGVALAAILFLPMCLWELIDPFIVFLPPVVVEVPQVFFIYVIAVTASLVGD